MFTEKFLEVLKHEGVVSIVTCANNEAHVVNTWNSYIVIEGDKMQALKNQKKMLMLKRKRLDGLIELINKTLKGANTMSFKEFDMTEYYNVLEEFKKENKDRVITNWGSIDKFDEMIENMKANETKIAKNIIKQYGSIKKCAEAVRNELNNYTLITRKEKYDEFKNDFLYDKHPKLKELYKKLTADLSKDPSSKEIQEIVSEIADTTKKDYEFYKGNTGLDYKGFFSVIADIYLSNTNKGMNAVDNSYGKDASKFVGEALKFYSEHSK
ncbi:tipAS antibiotic-recognition domain protein [Clostridium sporogenes]|nr:tipAS antibiotic-recognition domain protein [Clostridium sporogenes]